MTNNNLKQHARCEIPFSRNDSPRLLGEHSTGPFPRLGLCLPGPGLKHSHSSFPYLLLLLLGLPRNFVLLLRLLSHFPFGPPCCAQASRKCPAFSTATSASCFPSLRGLVQTQEASHQPTPLAHCHEHLGHPLFERGLVSPQTIESASWRAPSLPPRFGPWPRFA